MSTLFAVREEIIDGKLEVLRATIPHKEHPELVELAERANRLGHHLGEIPVVADAPGPLK